MGPGRVRFKSSAPLFGLMSPGPVVQALVALVVAVASGTLPSIGEDAAGPALPPPLDGLPCVPKVTCEPPSPTLPPCETGLSQLPVLGPADDAAENVPPGTVALGAWGAPTATSLADAESNYEQMAEAGLNIFVNNGVHDPVHNRNVISGTARHGMASLLTDERIPTRSHGSRLAHAIDPSDQLADDQEQALDALIADYADCPTLVSYFVNDEPELENDAQAGTPFAQDAEEFYGAVAAYLNEADPARFAFINHCGGCGTPPPGGDWGDQREEVLVLTGSAVLSYDFYPFLLASDRPNFFPYLEQARRVALQQTSVGNPVDVWTIVQLTAHEVSWGEFRELTEGEIRYQAMQALAHGSRGIFYFTYSLDASVDFTGPAMVDASHDPTVHYYEVQAINHDVARMGRYLAQAASVQVIRDPTTVSAGGGASGIPATSLSFVGAAPVTFGLYVMPAGIGPGPSPPRNYAVVANLDYGADADLSFTLSSGTPQRLDADAEDWVDLPGFSSTGVAALHLEPGDGALLRW